MLIDHQPLADVEQLYQSHHYVPYEYSHCQERKIPRVAIAKLPLVADQDGVHQMERLNTRLVWHHHELNTCRHQKELDTVGSIDRKMPE